MKELHPYNGIRGASQALITYIRTWFIFTNFYVWLSLCNQIEDEKKIVSKGAQPPMRMNTKSSALCLLEMEYQMFTSPCRHQPSTQPSTPTAKTFNVAIFKSQTLIHHDPMSEEILTQNQNMHYATISYDRCAINRDLSGRRRLYAEMTKRCKLLRTKWLGFSL